MAVEQIFANYDRNARYGVKETGNIAEFTDDIGAFLDGMGPGTYQLSDPAVVRITRVRLIGGTPCWDLSYCWGQLADGTDVKVDLGRYQFGRYSYKRELVQAAKDAGRFGKGMGLLDNISTLAG